MQLQIIEDMDQLQTFAGEWRALLGNSNANPYITPDWIEHWWKFYGHDRSLHVLRLYDENGTVGFFPLMKSQKRFYAEYRFIGQPQSGRIDLIVRQGFEEPFVRNVAAYLRNIKDKAVFYLHGINRYTPFRQTLVQELSGVSNVIKTLPCYIVDLKNTTQEDYFKHVRKHYTIKKTFSLERSLAKAVPLLFTKATAEEIPQIFPLHQKRWSKKNDENGFGKGTSKEFFTYLAQLKNTPDWQVHVFLLKAGELLIGFIYGIECNGRLTLYRIAHDDDFALYKPGMITFLKTFEESFARGIETVDFSTGSEPYKLFWADEYETVDQVIFSSRHWISRAVLAKTRLQYNLRQALKKSEALARFKRVTVGKIKYTLSGAEIRLLCRKIPQFVRLKGFTTLLLEIFPYSKGKSRLYTLPRFIPNAPKDNPFTFRVISLEELGTLTGLMMMNPDAIVRRYHQGDRCGIFLSDGQPAATVWLSQSEMQNKGTALWQPQYPEDVCFYDVSIFKRWKEQSEDILQCLARSAPRKKRAQAYLLIHRNQQIMQIMDRVCAAENLQKTGETHETVHS